MYTKALSLLLFFTFCNVFSQTNFKKGMYTSWESLRSNTPDKELASKVVYKKVMTNQERSEPHRIAVVKSDSENQILGFSNGKELFFNSNQPELKHKPFFNYVTMYGDRFGVYNSLFVIGINKSIGAGNFPMHCNVRGLELIDFKNGTITKVLNTSDLKTLIGNDPELLRRFKKEHNKSQKIKVYLLEYLMRNS